MGLNFSWENLTPIQAHEKNLDITLLKRWIDELPLFTFLLQDADLQEMDGMMKKLQGFDKIIILGTGGSSLGGQTIAALNANTEDRLYFMDNIDPHTFQVLRERWDLRRTGVIAISKSGNTAETLMQLVTMIQVYQETGLDVSEHIACITEPGNHHAMGEIIQHFGMTRSDHPTDIGGRFAAFTSVGLLPAMLAGVDVVRFRRAARDYVETLQQANKAHSMLLDQHPAIKGARVQYDLLKYHHISQSVLMPYCDRLEEFTLWYRQLWAESLGKKGQGTTPIASWGTVDQHSQLQLYLDGPKDKVFTVIHFTEIDHQSPRIQKLPEIQHPALMCLYGKNIGDLYHAEAQATVDTLKQNNLPMRVITGRTLNEETLAELLCHYITETLAMAVLLGVNPFDQEAVEQSKVLTRHYLQK